MVDEDFLEDFEEKEALLAHVDANEGWEINIDTLVDGIAGCSLKIRVAMCAKFGTCEKKIKGSKNPIVRMPHAVMFSPFNLIPMGRTTRESGWRLADNWGTREERIGGSQAPIGTLVKTPRSAHSI